MIHGGGVSVLWLSAEHTMYYLHTDLSNVKPRIESNLGGLLFFSLLQQGEKISRRFSIDPCLISKLFFVIPSCCCVSWGCLYCI